MLKFKKQEKKEDLQTMGARLVKTLVFRAPVCSYSRSLSNIHFVSRAHHSNAKVKVFIPVRIHKVKVGAPTIFFFHGRGEDLGSADFELLINRLGSTYANIVMFDYSSWGLHSSTTCSEIECVQDAIAVYRDIVSSVAETPDKITLLGFSLGAGIAIQFAHAIRKDVQQPNSLVLFASFYSLMSIVTWFPMRQIDIFKNYQVAPSITIPVLMFHGKDDATVPHSSAAPLCKMFPNMHMFEVIHDISHGDIFRENLPLWNTIKAFISENTP